MLEISVTPLQPGILSRKDRKSNKFKLQMISYDKNDINMRDLYIEKIQAVEKKRMLEKRVTEIKPNNSNSDNDSD